MAESERFLIDNAIARASEDVNRILGAFTARFPRKPPEGEALDTPEDIAARALRMTQRPRF
jgi:hypothetical protein